jgi:adenosylcobinamide-GDP ribazoletransferase
MSSARVLEIMKDSRIGAYGAIGTVCMLGLKCSALSYLPPLAVVGALLVAHPLSRLLAATLIWRMDYARAEGKAKPLAQTMRSGEYAIAAATTLAIIAGVVIAGALNMAAIGAGAILAAIATLWLARMFSRRIGGYTGDCLGAVQQASEVMIYLGVLAALGHAT